MDAQTKQFRLGYLFEVTSLCTEMFKDEIHVHVFGPAHEIWLLIDKCVNASLHSNAYIPSGTRSGPIIYASSEGSGNTAHCTRMFKDKIHVRVFGPAHEIWLFIDKCVNASLHAHAYVPSGTRSGPIIYASSEGSGETAHCTGMFKDKIHVRVFGPAHEIWLLIDKCVNASLHAHTYVPSGTRSGPIIYASSEGSGETALFFKLYLFLLWN